MPSDDRLQELRKEFLVAFARVAKRMADKTLECPYVDFEGEVRNREEVRKRFEAFLLNPNISNLQRLWNKKCITLAAGGDQIGQIRKKNSVEEIAQVFKEFTASDKYDSSWERLRVPWALRQLVGKSDWGTLPRLRK